jgi:hypothetical protein
MKSKKVCNRAETYQPSLARKSGENGLHSGTIFICYVNSERKVMPFFLQKTDQEIVLCKIDF